MAPTTIMMRNSAVTMPVMLYKMIIATAVVGDLPRMLPPPAFAPLLVPFIVFISTCMLVLGLGGLAAFKP